MRRHAPRRSVGLRLNPMGGSDPIGAAQTLEPGGGGQSSWCFNSRGDLGGSVAPERSKLWREGRPEIRRSCSGPSFPAEAGAGGLPRGLRFAVFRPSGRRRPHETWQERLGGSLHSSLSCGRQGPPSKLLRSHNCFIKAPGFSSRSNVFRRDHFVPVPPLAGDSRVCRSALDSLCACPFHVCRLRVCVFLLMLACRSAAAFGTHAQGLWF